MFTASCLSGHQVLYVSERAVVFYENDADSGAHL
jgi:hypothetical protein